ncbi:hypothetical protein [Streptomyces cyaneofuscatus]|uniref:hypothetical protein n=1 Tax=Streptomyces cyaneofuscatus TaxID=66883 RepID=UPI0036B4F9D7
MEIVVLCAAFWAGAAKAVAGCVRRWRLGADQVWSAKWQALAGALAVTALSVAMTAWLVPPGARVLLEGAVLMLLVGSAGSVVAGWVASHRSQAQAWAVRQGLGLPIERKLWDPMTIVSLWLAAAIPAVAAVALIAAWFVEAHSAPGTGGARAGVEAITSLLVLTIGGFIAAGLLHGLIQHQRRAREQHRIRTADQQYLNDPHG